MRRARWLAVVCIGAGLAAARADESTVAALLARPLLSKQLPFQEVQSYLQQRIPEVPRFASVEEYERYARELRTTRLDKVVFRGAADEWRKAPLKVEWLATIPGGPGYRIKKLRYEAVPGAWIPALLYEPEKLAGKTAAVLNVNGHDPKGKATPYKQLRCINLAKRGLLALNVEWLGMGQLHNDNWLHYRMNQLDLCGTSGLAVFFLAMQRGLDVLLTLEHADPERVAVTGLSGGGWQTIFLSALDTRVKLANPVAGYCSYHDSVRYLDLGDSEQSPTDFAMYADYAHLTALLAPRPALLTYNTKDDCCFMAAHSLPRLLATALPLYRLHGREGNLHAHVNHDPGTHNYERDNREAFYRFVAEHFYANEPSFERREIPSEGEVKTPEELHVELPKDNGDFHSLALTLSRSLPRAAEAPTDGAARETWEKERRQRLRELVRSKDFAVRAIAAGSNSKNKTRADYWWLKLNDAWTVPAVELSRGAARETVLLVADAGRASVAADAERHLAAGRRVLAVDPFFIGESKIDKKDVLFALLLNATGDRPVGLQASQLLAIAGWSRKRHPGERITLEATGPRLGLAALIAAAMAPDEIDGVELHGALGSLKEVIETNRTVEQGPELFCFGLLAEFDIKQLSALTKQRP